MGKCTWWPPTHSDSFAQWELLTFLPITDCSDLNVQLPRRFWKFLFRVQTPVSARASLPRWEKSVWCESLQGIKVQLYRINILFWQSQFIIFCLMSNKPPLLNQVEQKHIYLSKKEGVDKWIRPKVANKPLCEKETNKRSKKKNKQTKNF